MSQSPDKDDDVIFVGTKDYSLEPSLNNNLAVQGPRQEFDNIPDCKRTSVPPVVVLPKVRRKRGRRTLFTHRKKKAPTRCTWSHCM